MTRAVLGLTAALLGCSDGAPSAAPKTLDQVSAEVQLESANKLGPHHYLATVRVIELAGDEESTRDETTELVWGDWDNFKHLRRVDGEVVSGALVLNAKAWRKTAGGKWKKKPDAEPVRAGLRGIWNAWDQAFEPFGDRIAYADAGRDLIEGRPVQVYTLSLAPDPLANERGAKRRAREGGPVDIRGQVWVDEATAVRLKADVTGVVERLGTKRTIHLSLTRSAVGEPPKLKPPGQNP